MKIGMLGLGRMGGNMAQRLARRGHEVIGYDPAAARAPNSPKRARPPPLRSKR